MRPDRGTLRVWEPPRPPGRINMFVFICAGARPRGAVGAQTHGGEGRGGSLDGGAGEDDGGRRGASRGGAQSRILRFINATWPYFSLLYFFFTAWSEPLVEWMIVDISSRQTRSDASVYCA